LTALPCRGISDSCSADRDRTFQILKTIRSFIIKESENLEAAVALHYMHYNFVHIHQTLRVDLEAGIATHVWTLEEIVRLMD
jgi:hypothetical protein